MVKRPSEPLEKRVSVGIDEMIYEGNAELCFYNGNFVEPSEFIITASAHTIHYGSGFFEGIRFFGNEKGGFFLSLDYNVTRFINSSLTLSNILYELIEERGYTKLEIKGVERMYKQALEEERITVTAYKGKRGEEVELYIPAYNEFYDGIFEYKHKHIKNAILCTLLINEFFPKFPAYIRPIAGVAGKGGLKVTTYKKPLFFGIFILPWGKYLREEDYKRGVTVFVSPYPKINQDMDPGRKISGNYINSQKVIDIGLRIAKKATGIDFGETLVMNKEGKLVEGSAENLFVIVEEKGKEVVYVPETRYALPGTTRQRIIEWLKENGYKVKIGQFSFEELKRMGKRLKGMFLSGTAAQLIHVREVWNLPYLGKALEGFTVTDRDGVVDVSIANKEKEVIVINNGKQPELVEKLLKEISMYGKKTYPWDIDIDAIAEMTKKDKNELISVLTEKERRAFFRKVDGMNEEEMLEKFKAAAKVARHAFSKIKMAKVV